MADRPTLRLWLLAMDATRAVHGVLLRVRFPGQAAAWRLCLWCVRKASGATDWGESPPIQEGDAPW